MAQIPNSVRVTGLIAPSDDTDLYPSHHAKWGKGGLRTVADLTERNNISVDRREEGMIVFVQAGAVMFQLVGGITNGDWIPYNAASEWQDIGVAPADFIAPADGATKKVCVGTITNPPSSGSIFRIEDGSLELKGTNAGAWNGPHLIMGNYHFWIDGSGFLRMKDGVPTSDTDVLSVIVGTQS